MKIFNINYLKEHEMVDCNHLSYIKNKIAKKGIFTRPIIVDREYLVVLDGHHRLNSCKALGLSKIPCQMVDYLDNPNIKVVPRRKDIYITKQIVVAMGLSGRVFPPKTTKHFIPKRERKVRVRLETLV